MLARKFFERKADLVARDLLGKILVRKISDTLLKGKIVETEAYFGENDPASRAYEGMKNYNKEMWGDPGKIFVYNVHKYWMFNVVAHLKNEVGAVLIRAVQPIDGIEVMMKSRRVNDIKDLTNGPGKLTEAFRIDKSFNGKFLGIKTGIWIEDCDERESFNIGKSFRIGVKKDLRKKLRFYISGNEFVSR